MKVYFSKLENNLVLVDEYSSGYYFVDDFLWPVMMINKKDLIYVGEL